MPNKTIKISLRVTMKKKVTKNTAFRVRKSVVPPSSTREGVE